MKAFIQDLAQKEAVAKQKLSDMMEQLLRRAETAEEELEVCRSFVSGAFRTSVTRCIF